MLVLRDREPGRSFSTTNAVKRRALAVGDREHDVEVGDAGVGDPVLRPVDHPLVAVEHRARAHRRGVRAGVGLGQAERRRPLAARAARQEALPSARPSRSARSAASRAPGPSGSARTPPTPSPAPRPRPAASACRSRCRRTPRRTAARARPARPAGGGCPTGTRPSRRSRPRAARSAPARAAGSSRGSPGAPRGARRRPRSSAGSVASYASSCPRSACSALVRCVPMSRIAGRGRLARLRHGDRDHAVDAERSSTASSGVVARPSAAVTSTSLPRAAAYAVFSAGLMHLR